MAILYFDCFSGISGDMTLAALVDLGADPKKIETELGKLPFEKASLSFDKVIKKGISALKLRITLGENRVQFKMKAHSHTHDLSHTHDHVHSHSDGHRHYREIVQMIQQSDLTDLVKERSVQIFTAIGIAEAKIHQVPLEDVHFHEVGAVDSIIDIVGTAIALEDLGVEKIYSSPVAVGNGSVFCDHGLYPVPAPATIEILRNIPIRSTEENGELTTPTGAGILSSLCVEYGPMPTMTVNQIGYGAGEKELQKQPNVLRVMLGELA
jgi:pyridinium-3,5-bisthiocarboxylic acid mononucleotide nickel chelatase